jgi:hypothetical protein
MDTLETYQGYGKGIIFLFSSYSMFLMVYFCVAEKSGGSKQNQSS